MRARVKPGATAQHFPTLDDVDVAGKRVLVRMDLNVPMIAGRVTDNTRIVRLLPTITELLKKKAKVIILSHLGRPEGKYVPDLSLAPLVDALSQVLRQSKITFGVDCIGPEAQAAVAALKSGDIVLLENLRFHAGEEKNDPKFALALSAHGDVYVNDAFSCSHRAHASVVGIAKHLPAVAGRLLEEELNNLEMLFENPTRPLTAIIGGAKVSTKLKLLENLIDKVDNLIIGGAMANTFLIAQGYTVGASLTEPKLKAAVRRILNKAKGKCNIITPLDVMYAPGFAVKTSNIITSGTSCIETTTMNIAPPDTMIFDIGNLTLNRIAECLNNSKTVIWNGPLGIFEQRPGVSTIWLAREIARLTQNGLKSIVGGGDTIAAINAAGLSESFTYISTAGGAFLEWMEGKTLPGVAALLK